jgi:hypothetical protein
VSNDIWLVEAGERGLSETSFHEFPSEHVAEAFARAWSGASEYWAEITRNGSLVTRFGSRFDVDGTPSAS